MLQRIENRLKDLVIGIMQAFEIPISLVPGWYLNVTAERECYRPFYEPWRADLTFQQAWRRGLTCANSRTAHLLFSLAMMSSGREGEFWECGVYRGGTAKLLARARGARDATLQHRPLRLFDTFSGMPEKRSEADTYEIGSFGDTSLEEVKLHMAGEAGVEFHPGFIPDTFRGLEEKSIAFAHIDVDQYATTKACCSFIFPRLVAGGVMVIDDYGRPGTFGARLGTDECLSKFGLKPVVLSTGQAMIVR
jgi:O-methyltransferase